MHRIGVIFSLGLMPLLALGQAGNSAPLIHFSFYAPPQPDSPVHIVGFEHDESVIRFELSNTSDKSVVAVAITRVDIVPEGCSTEPSAEPHRPAKNSNPGGYKVSITPHGKGVAAKEGIQLIGTGASPRYSHEPRKVVDSAKWARAGYMQAQFGITGVLFEDGSSWPSQVAIVLRDDFDPFKSPSPAASAAVTAINHPDPFDDSLVEAESGTCTDVATVASALRSVKEVVFGSETPLASDPADDKSAIPHLRFSCSLEGSKAVCRLPLEKRVNAQQSRPAEAEQR
jgi:hypothetical protein